MADPFYARSSLSGTVPDALPPVQDGTPAPAAGTETPGEPTPGAIEPGTGDPPEPAATLETPSPEPGQPPVAAPPSEGTPAAGVTPEDPPPAEFTPEQRLAQADELIRLAREEPAKFAAEHSIEMAPRFAKLGHMAQDLRRKEQQLKDLEAGNAEKVKTAEEIISLLERDKVGFIKKHLGEEGMARLNRAALSQDDPNFAAVSRLEEIIEAQNRRLEELTTRLDGGAPSEIPPEEAAHANAYFERKANEFSTDYRHLAEQPENKRLIDFFGADAVRDDAVEIVTNVYKSTGRELTAGEVWSMLNKEFDGRMQKMNGTAPPAGIPPTQQPQPSSEPGSANRDNVTTELAPLAETDFSPAAERRRMAAIAARHSKG